MLDEIKTKIQEANLDLHVIINTNDRVISIGDGFAVRYTVINNVFFMHGFYPNSWLFGGGRFDYRGVLVDVINIIRHFYPVYFTLNVTYLDDVFTPAKFRNRRTSNMISTFYLEKESDDVVSS